MGDRSRVGGVRQGQGAVDMGVVTEMHEACPHRAVVRGVGHLGSVAVYVCMWFCAPTNVHVRARRRQGAAWYPFFQALGNRCLRFGELVGGTASCPRVGANWCLRLGE